MRVLIVGGGSVGAVLGYALTRAGAEVDFVVKRERADTCMRGFRVFHVDRRGDQARYRARLVLSDWEDVSAAGPYEVVLVTTPSDGLRGAWFDAMVEATRGARVVLFQRGVGDDAWAESRAPGTRFDRGMIGFLAYEAPLESGVGLKLGTAFWTPPMARTLFSPADDGALDELCRALEEGGVPSGVRDDITQKSLSWELLCMALVMALEPVGYRADVLAKNRHFGERAVLAVRDAAKVLGALHDENPSALLPRLDAKRITLGLMAARMLTPFPLEAYLREHFGKVKPQMAHNRTMLVREARRLAIDVPRLEALHLMLSRGGDVSAPSPLFA